MNAAASLAASADLAETRGRNFTADLYRSMARDAADMGPQIGNVLYRHWAAEAAQYVTGLKESAR